MRWRAPGSGAHRGACGYAADHARAARRSPVQRSATVARRGRARRGVDTARAARGTAQPARSRTVRPACGAGGARRGVDRARTRMASPSRPAQRCRTWPSRPAHLGADGTAGPPRRAWTCTARHRARRTTARTAQHGRRAGRGHARRGIAYCAPRRGRSGRGRSWERRGRTRCAARPEGAVCHGSTGRGAGIPRRAGRVDANGGRCDGGLPATTCRGWGTPSACPIKRGRGHLTVVWARSFLPAVVRCRVRGGHHSVGAGRGRLRRERKFAVRRGPDRGACGAQKLAAHRSFGSWRLRRGANLRFVGVRSVGACGARKACGSPKSGLRHLRRLLLADRPKTGRWRLRRLRTCRTKVAGRLAVCSAVRVSR